MSARIRRRSFFIILGLVVLACGAACLIARGISQRSDIYANAPPPYPNSQLFSQEEWLTSSSCEEERIYTTSDSVDEVLAYMEEHMPGFSQEESASGEGPVYSNLYRDTSWAAYVAALMQTLPGVEVEAHLPTVHVWIYGDMNTLGTTIRYFFFRPCS